MQQGESLKDELKLLSTWHFISRCEIPSLHLSHIMRNTLLFTSLVALSHAAAVPSRETGLTLQLRGAIYPLYLTKTLLIDDCADNTTSGISEDLFDNFKLFANFTAAAYCLNNENSTAGSLITCAGSNCTPVEADNVTAIVEFGGS